MIETVDLDLNLVIVVIEKSALIEKSVMKGNIQYLALDQKVLLEAHRFVKNCHQNYRNVMQYRLIEN